MFLLWAYQQNNALKRRWCMQKDQRVIASHVPVGDTISARACSEEGEGKQPNIEHTPASKDDRLNEYGYVLKIAPSTVIPKNHQTSQCVVGHRCHPLQHTTASGRSYGALPPSDDARNQWKIHAWRKVTNTDQSTP